MNLKSIKTEHVLYFLILGLAFGIRILNIDHVPLSEVEASKALEAFTISKGGNPAFSPGPAYSIFTGITFFLFGDTNATARLWPILIGCCLVGFPYLIRSIIGRKAALIMALGLALSPTMVAFSRSANSEIMAAGFGMLAIGFLLNRKLISAGVFLGLMLLSGSPAIQGVIGIVITLLLGLVLTRLNAIEKLEELTPLGLTRKGIISGMVATLVVILLVGSLFFLHPSGLGAAASIIPHYFQGLVNASGTGIGKLLLALVIYSPVAIVFGTLSIIQAWRKKDAVSQWLSIWAGVSFLFLLLYPGSQVSSLVWTLIALWGLAGVELARYFKLESAETLPSIGQALLIFLLMALGWLNLVGLGSIGGVVEADQLRWAIIMGTIVLGGVTTLLIGLGWSVKTAQQGLVWGVLVGLSVYSVSVMWGVSQLRPNLGGELISSSNITLNSRDFQETLGDLSEWRTGIRDALDVILTTTSPSLMWEMRHWSEARFLPDVPVGELPSVIINTQDQPSPNLAIGYRGQDFVWRQTPGWSGLLPENWTRWLVFRDAPMNQTNIVMWARGDLFPGGVIGEAPAAVGGPDEDLPASGLPVE